MTVPSFRIGHGYDIHRFGEGGTLVLGGVRFPELPALHGHSDGDAVLHAVADALLGAAALGDLGLLFPPGDPATRGADSAGLLRVVVERVRAAGYAVGNVDVTVIAERPRLAARLGELRAAVVGVLGVDVADVSVKAKTNEGLDAIGRGEAIAVYAVALIVRAGG